MNQTIQNARKLVSNLNDISEVVYSINNSAMFEQEEMAAAYALIAAEENGYKNDADNISAQLEFIEEAGAVFSFEKAISIAKKYVGANHERI